MAGVGALGSAAALLSPSCLRLCFVTRPQALQLEPLEAALLKEAGEGSDGSATPSPVLRPSILAGAFVRVRFDDAYRLDRIASTQLTPDGRVAVRLQVTGRSVALSSLSRGSPLEDDAAARQQQEAVQQELAALQGALAGEPPTCWEIAAACCRLSTAWQWAQHPSVFAAVLQRGLPSVAAQLEDAAAVEAVLCCVESAVPVAAAEAPSAAAAAECFLAAMAAQSVHPAAAPGFAPAVPTPAQPVLLAAAAPMSAEPVVGVAAAAAGGSGHWEAGGGSSHWEEPPEQYQRIVTFVPDDEEQQQWRQKRGRDERGSPPAKRSRSEASPVPPRSADRSLDGSLADWKRRQIEQDVPPGSRREGLLLEAVKRSCPPGQERQGGELGNALRKLDSDWKERLGDHSLTDLLLAMHERGLLALDLRKDPNSTGSSLNVYYSRAPARPPLPPARKADSRQLAADVPPGSRREALLVRAVAMSCPAGQERLIGNLGNALATLDSAWESRLGGHSLPDLLMEMTDRGLAGMEIRSDPRSQKQLVYYSQAVPPPPPAKQADRQQLAADVPPGSSREALLLRAVEMSCPAGQERQGGDLGNALAALDRDWKARLGGHSITDLLLEMNKRGLVRAESRRDPNSKCSGRNVYYSRAPTRPLPPAVRPPDSQAPQRPQPAAVRAGTGQMAQDVPPGSSREALLVQAVAEQDSKKPGQLLSPANLGEILNRLHRGWKAGLGGHKLNDHVWELHRRGFVRAEERTSATGQRNLFFTNLCC